MEQTFEGLPRDVRGQIFEYLPPPDILRSTQVSSTFLPDLTNRYWYNKIQQDFGKVGFADFKLPTQYLDNVNYRDKYLQFEDFIRKKAERYSVILVAYEIGGRFPISQLRDYLAELPDFEDNMRIPNICNASTFNLYVKGWPLAFGYVRYATIYLTDGCFYKRYTISQETAIKLMYLMMLNGELS